MGAAGIAATAFAGLGGQALAATARPDPGLDRNARESGSSDQASAGDAEAVVAHVRDAGTGQIDLFRGTTQVRVHDTDLAAKLVRAAGNVTKQVS